MMRRLLFLALVFAPAPAFAQVPEPAPNAPAKAPALVFLAGASADWSTTAWNYRHAEFLEEKNPLLRPLAHHPALMIGTGAALDLLSLRVWQHATRHHHRLQAIGLYGMAGVRAYLAVRNLRWASWATQQEHQSRPVGEP